MPNLRGSAERGRIHEESENRKKKGETHVKTEDVESDRKEELLKNKKSEKKKGKKQMAVLDIFDRCRVCSRIMNEETKSKPVPTDFEQFSKWPAGQCDSKLEKKNGRSHVKKEEDEQWDGRNEAEIGKKKVKKEMKREELEVDKRVVKNPKKIDKKNGIEEDQKAERKRNQICLFCEATKQRHEMTKIPKIKEKIDKWIGNLGEDFGKRLDENNLKSAYICLSHFPGMTSRGLNDVPMARSEENLELANVEDGEKLCDKVEELHLQEIGEEKEKRNEMKMEMWQRDDTGISLLDISPKCRVCLEVLDGEAKTVPTDQKSLARKSSPLPISIIRVSSAMSLPPHAATHSRLVQFYRLRKEIADLKQSPRGYIKSFQKLHKNKEVYIFKVQGDGEIYGKSILTISVDVTLDYPFKTQILRFIHPVSAKFGKIRKC
ncbi:unnamed protein product [Caenorhabditis angaria]|uniref:Uncharacterized protein n=1 Tax=Caenorhabditis angaria TaxID=860376 RepID=A0A9P1IEY1_9PELO|nr:unnamed protein product [Caenorhabditis angaria]